MFVNAVQIGFLLYPLYPLATNVAHLAKLQLVRVYVIRKLFYLIEADFAASVRSLCKAYLEYHYLVFPTI